MMIEGMIRIGQYDADDLQGMKENETFQKYVKEGKIWLDGDYDKGNVWVIRDDALVFLCACSHC